MLSLQVGIAMLGLSCSWVSGLYTAVSFVLVLSVQMSMAVPGLGHVCILYVCADLMPRRKRSRSQDFMPEASGDLKRQKSASVPRPGAQPDFSFCQTTSLACNSSQLFYLACSKHQF